MKYIFLIFFISFLSSSEMKKVYVYEDGIERHTLFMSLMHTIKIPKQT